jgi:threonine dehydrogenase-like Zn-dependent dehydrogenase
MRAIAIFPEARSVELIEIEAPHIRRRHDVLLKVRQVGVCGTDREIAAFEYGEPPPGTDHLVLGHESLAEVVEVGSDVSSLHPGDLVVPMVRRPCPHARCRACRAHRQDFCTTGDFTERGIKHMHGFMAEYVLDEEQYLVRVPQALAEVAVLVEPLTIAAKAHQQVASMKARRPFEQIMYRGVVLGGGAVGLLGAMSLVADGMDTYMFARKPDDSALAQFVKGFGGHYISSSKVAPAELARHIGDIDVVFEATGASSFAFDTLTALGPNGIFVLTGVPGPGAPKPIEADRIMRDMVLKNQVLVGVVNAGRSAYDEAIALLERFMALFPESLRRLVSERVALEDAVAALRATAALKAIVDVQQ